MALHRYRYILQEGVRSSDSKWSYLVPDLPQVSASNAAGFVKSCAVVSNSQEQNITLTFVRPSLNRAISDRPLNLFLHVTFDGFRLQTEDGEQAPFRESADYISRLLKYGFCINGTQYHFYGHSQSQLKSRSCFLMAGSKHEVNQIVDNLGDFSKMKTVAKKVKRIGLLFSTAHIVMDVDPVRVNDIADVEDQDYIFTDGCGLISKNLAQMLTRKRPIIFRNRRYHPSVFQIRYRGYKGVVTIEPQMQPGIWLELRKSMKKFSGGSNLGFAVVEFSKPYSYGYLNDEVVLLLHALGISEQTLLRKQQEHLSTLEDATRNARTAFQVLTSLGHFDLAEKLLLEGKESVERSVVRIVNEEHGKMLNKRNEQKCRILVPKSRLLFGVCDPRDLLQPGQCFVKVTHDDGAVRCITGTWVLVARNPCLHPGDLQKFWAVAHPELEHLVDCIVFSTRGKRPAADLMSGGDLDGDTFFVCWDSELVPTSVSEAAEYPPGKEHLQFRPITHDDRIDYFARSSSIQLGRIKKLYLQWARYKGPMSTQCQELNRLFSQCVDANKVEIPPRLSNLPDDTNQSPFILDILHDAARAHVLQSTPKVSFDNSSAVEVLESVLSENNNASHFELAQITLRWCQANKAPFKDFWLYFDPRKLISEERAWLLANLPPSTETPPLIMNDLLHSEILDISDLQQFGLQHPGVRWRLVFNSHEDRLANLLHVVDRTFTHFTRKLLVLNIHDRLSVAIYVPVRVDRADECAVNSRVRLFSFPHGQKNDRNYRRVVPTKHNSRLYFDHSTLQLFERQRANTFVFLTRSANSDSQYRSIDGRGNKARVRESTIEGGVNYEWRTSIALGKFSSGLATHIGRLNREAISSAELYVIGNDDTRSLRRLDLWLEQVDTDKVISNFEETEDKPFEVPHMNDIDWRTVPDTVVRIARDRKFDMLDSIYDIDQISQLLDIAWQTCSFDLASQVYQHYLGSLRDETRDSRKMSVLRFMLGFLDSMPNLVIHFCRLCPWNAVLPCVQKALDDAIVVLVRALILSSVKMGRLVVQYLRAILYESRYLTIGDLRELVELVALTIPDPGLAMDILLEGLEPCSTRILLDTPRKTEYLIRQLTGTALDHIEEGSDQVNATGKTSKYPWRFELPFEESENGILLKCSLRIDAPKATKLAKGDHVRFTSIGEPSNAVLVSPWTFYALVTESRGGEFIFRCIQRPPVVYRNCAWGLEHRGSFTTSKTMMDAVVDLMERKGNCCSIFRNLFPHQAQNGTDRILPSASRKYSDRLELNQSQNEAINTALCSPLTLIWGPPGTGKTHTIVTLCQSLLQQEESIRLLVTAPTHNAVDNVMRQYIKRSAGGRNQPLRVSTDIHKVSKDLMAMTCDGMLGQDINSNHSARRKAQKQIRASHFIFTTCVGAGLGLLRSESFDTVIIDEASQQTEPASLIPLVKGCKRAILVGDHVQLRATVRPNAATQGFDVSLFERLWTERTGLHESTVQRVMLNTQYRMHPSLCSFPSQEFYEGKLMTASSCVEIKVPAEETCFTWPKGGGRSVFIQCDAPEDLGLRSKSNAGQAKVCQEIIRRIRTPRPPPASSSSSPQSSTTQETLTSPPTQPSSSPQHPSIAILTPYTRQLDLLRRLIPDNEIKISTIDGFQGQEADIIIYVTVRCNVHGDIGFLRDLRRLNVAITRPRAGLVVIGDRATLTMRKEGDEDEAKMMWRRLLDSCAVMSLD